MYIRKLKDIMILNSKVIICAGNDSKSSGRWNNYLGLRKHMIPANNEPLIRRIQRQLLERKFTNVFLSCSQENKNDYLLNNIRYCPSPRSTGHFCERSVTWHYKRYFDEQKTTVLILGDVYFTDKAIETLSKDAGDIFKIYGRAGKSSITKNNREGEPFAIILPDRCLSKYFECMSYTASVLPDLIKKNEAIHEDLPKYTYRRFVDIPYSAPGHIVENKHWINIDDLTDDFDYPYDWDIKSKLFPDIFYIT